MLNETVRYELVQLTHEGPLFHTLRDTGTVYWLKRFFEACDQLSNRQ
jgi:hypothetical protein